jgi:hypothetical protein
MSVSEYILYSMITKTTMIWIACILFLVVITTKSMAHDTVADKVNNWATNEKEKTIAYQKESWANSKEQLGKTWNSIKTLFNNKAQ